MLLKNFTVIPTEASVFTVAVDFTVPVSVTSSVADVCTPLGADPWFVMVADIAALCPFTTGDAVQYPVL